MKNNIKDATRDKLAFQRTHLANERTLLAFWRTALAFVGVGLILIKFIDSWASRIIAVISIFIGALMFIYGSISFFSYKKDINKRENHIEK
ncbi:DUF202 domain-containing protein [Candidatus Woesearchaeota archaeon]|nr:DUF202 domain-containing protein [Candidatus Woesearchaeota archaeon]